MHPRNKKEYDILSDEMKQKKHGEPLKHLPSDFLSIFFIFR